MSRHQTRAKHSSSTIAHLVCTSSNVFENTNTGSWYIAPGNALISATKYGENSVGNASWNTGSGLYCMISGVYQTS